MGVLRQGDCERARSGHAWKRSGHACKGLAMRGKGPAMPGKGPAMPGRRRAGGLGGGSPPTAGVGGRQSPLKKRGLGGGSPPQKSGGWGAAAPHQKNYKEFQFIKWILFSPQLFSPAMPLRVRLRFARPCLKGPLGLDGRGAPHCRPLGRQMRAAPRTV